MIELRNRTKRHVEEFWFKTQDEEINRLFPRNTTGLDDALRLFEDSHSQNSTSFGKVIYIDNQYIGDVWIFGIDEAKEKMAMLSVVIFDKTYWGKGIGPVCISKFCEECFERFKIEQIGAFVYAHNNRSIKMLEKAKFTKVDVIIEDEEESFYYELKRPLIV